MHEKIGTLELDDKDQIQNKEPIFSLPEDVNRLFSVARSPTKDANLMLNKVRCKNRLNAPQQDFLLPLCHLKTILPSLF